MATPYTINLKDGGQIVVNASSPQAAMENAGNPAGASVSAGSYSTPGNKSQQSGGGGQQQQQSGGDSGGGGGGGVTAAQLDAQFQKMLAALASGNAQQFEEAKSEFNRQFDESKREFDLGRGDSLAQFEKNFGLQQGALTGVVNGQPTLAARAQTEQTRQFDATQAEQIRQFERSMGLQEGTLTGVYNGAPTLAAQNQQAVLSGQYNGAPTESARQFNTTTAENQRQFNANMGSSLLQAATQLRGPRDYLQYQQLTRGGQDLMSQLYGNQPIPQTGAPTGQLQSANLQNALGDIGWNPQQGGVSVPGQGTPTQQQMDAQALMGRFGLQPTTGQQLNPSQIDPARWDAMGQIGRDLTKNLAETYGGFDGTDFEAQINATRPQGTAPRRTGVAYRAPQGIF